MTKSLGRWRCATSLIGDGEDAVRVKHRTHDAAPDLDDLIEGDEPAEIFFNAARPDRSIALRTDDYLALAAADRRALQRGVVGPRSQSRA